jgi:hypothetical protein
MIYNNEDLGFGSVVADSMTDADCLDLLNKFRKKAERVQLHEDNGKIVESFVSSRSVTAYATDVNDTLVYWNQSAPLAQQQIRNIVNTFVSVVGGNVPSVLAVAQHQEFAASEEIVNKYIEYLEVEEDLANKIRQVIEFATLHGTAAMKVIQDTTINRVTWTPLSIFDFWIENAQNPEASSWCVIKDLISEDQAEIMLDGISQHLPATTEYVDSAGITWKDKIEKYEIWQKPNKKYPKGLYACIIGDKVVEKMDYPHAFEEIDGDTIKYMLPIHLFRVFKIRGSCYGSSFSIDLCPIQASINKIFNSQVNIAINSYSKVLMPKVFSEAGIEDVLKEDDRFIYLNQSQMDAAANIRPLATFKSDPNLQATIDQLKQTMFEIAGISESTTGADTSGTPSGRKLMIQAQLDKNKYGGTSIDLHTMIKNSWELTLKLIQKYYTESQQFQISGKDPIYIKNVDIGGVSIRFEAKSERESTKAAKIERAMADMQAGLIGPESMRRINPTLLSESQRLISNQIIDDALDDKPIDFAVVLEQVDPNILVEEIDTRIADALIRQKIDEAGVLKQFRIAILRALSAGSTPDNAPSAPAQSNTVLPDQPQPAEQEMLEQLPGGV